jgi:hypothetical protein
MRGDDSPPAPPPGRIGATRAAVHDRAMPATAVRVLPALAFALAACERAQAPQQPQPQPPASRPLDEDAAPYAGPRLSARLEAPDSAGARVAVIEVEAPSGGYELQLDAVDERGAATRALVTLTEPGAGEANVTVLETKTVRANVPPGSGKVEVRVSIETRGVQYLRKPPYQLAATLAR